MIKIETKILKDLSNKAYSVCSFDKMAPLTELMEIDIKKDKIIIRSTDSITNLFVSADIKDNEEEMRIVVDANIFNSLINKITTEYIELNVNNNSLMISGNGVYYLDVRVDENGEIIKFPEINIDESKATKDINLVELRKKLAICRSAIPDNFDAPELNNYYLKENIVATNAYKITSIENDENIKDEELFITKELGNILISLDYGAAKYYKEDNKLYIIGPNLKLVGNIGKDLEKYPLEAIKNKLNDSFSYKAIINKGLILSLLDRLSLFVSEYDSNSINILFLPDKMKITSKKKTGDEDIAFKESIEGLTEFNCDISILNLKAQIESLPSEEIEIHFGGNEDSIKIIDKNITQIVSLMNEE
ncbi:MAG: hypothetical protein IJM36_05835 [Acholeplasmatales bacterium]|nr:hypothetical protein [Acholeplasmatales bacterium]